MEPNYVKSEIKRRKAIFNSNCEIGLEGEMVLPDACPDIERILKCTANARVNQKRLDFPRLFVSGTVFLRVLYLDKQNCVQSYDTQIPFSKNIDVNGEGENPVVSIKTSLQYLNCRQLSERRIDTRLTLCMNVNIKACDTMSVVCDIEDEGAEVKREKIEIVEPVYSACESFTAMEEYELAHPISAVTKMNADARILEYKLTAGRVLLRGEVEIDICYLCSENSAVQTAHYILPVSHILSCPDAMEQDNISASLEICKISCEPIGKGESREISVEVLLEACLNAERKREIDAVVDAYLIGRECIAHKREEKLCAFEESVEKNHRFSLKVDADDISEVIDTYAEIKNAQFTLNEQGEIMAKCDVDACLVYRNSQGEALSVNKTAPFEVSLAADRRYAGAKCQGDIKVLTAKSGQSRKEAFIDALISANVTKEKGIDVLHSMDISEKSAVDTGDKTALTIYFATAGEDAFDIAKKYGTSARAVIEENALPDTYIKENKRIVIPMIR